MTSTAKYFSKSEIECKCGCGTSFVTKKSLEKLDKLREVLEVPLILNSACRCPEHNNNVGGAKRSRHLSTKKKHSDAFDIRITGNLTKKQIIDAAKKVGFKGIGGSYQSFVHVDDRVRSATW